MPPLKGLESNSSHAVFQSSVSLHALESGVGLNDMTSTSS